MLRPSYSSWFVHLTSELKSFYLLPLHVHIKCKKMAGENICRQLSAIEFFLRRKSPHRAFTYYFNVHMETFDRAPAVSDDKQRILNPGT
jgi:hypothetical protein